VLKAYPSGLYQLNQFFYPHVRLEFNIQHSPVTSLVIKTPEASRIVLLDPRHRLHNLSTVELRDILVTRTFGDKIYDVIHGVTDPFLRDCLAQLAQDVSTWGSIRKDHEVPFAEAFTIRFWIGQTLLKQIEKLRLNFYGNAGEYLLLSFSMI
jgi:hypothetical protein